MKWVGLAAGPAGGGTVFIKVVTAIWFQVVITDAFLPEADGTAATGVAAPRENDQQQRDGDAARRVAGSLGR